ncbi:MAG: phosphate ABC transporter permease subunit PstC [Acidimicrobiia bacterium]|nr:phosphate ABC transporter permease subunit PstC [Acidimicrobiia bacterium]
MTEAMGAPGALTLAQLGGDARRMRKEAVVRAMLSAAASVSILVSVGIVYALSRQAIIFVTNVEWSAVLFSDGWYPRQGVYDLRTLIVGSVLVTAVAMMVAVPVGFGSAIYLSEYARPGVRRFLKPSLEVLAGLPSVVLGFFAISVISPSIVQRLFDSAKLFNLTAAGIAVGILSIPLIASVSEDALRAVPDSLREASYGMGARRSTTVLRVVVPAAVSGLVAAAILAVSRAIGETMIVFIAAGAAGSQSFSLDPLKPGLTMTAAMATQAQGTDQVVGEGLTFQSLYFVAAVLFAVTLALNIVAGRFVRRVRQSY